MEFLRVRLHAPAAALPALADFYGSRLRIDLLERTDGLGEPQALAAALAAIGLELWDGTVAGPSALGFVGERARTLILARPGRPWLPTARPAEAHPAEVELSGPPVGDAPPADPRYSVRRL